MGDFKPVKTLLLLLATATVATEATVSHECTRTTMRIRVPLEKDLTGVEADRWGEIFPDCRGVKTSAHYLLILSLEDSFCGMNILKNKHSGETIYSTTIAIKTSSGSRQVKLKCSSNDKGTNIVKRNVFHPEFVEPDFIEITSEVTGTAPIPILNVGVRQNGQLVGGQINVRPGTPLNMEVFLDDTSANIYGILMNFMEVTDMANKRETIIFNGCSVDPILFDNFVTTTGDYVSAKFRAFKFPETNYVLFRGTVDVCLDKCQGIACSNGQLGYGRRRRGIDDEVPDPNKIFEVTMMTFLKVEETLNGTTLQDKMLSEVKNHVAEEVKAVERALEEMTEERMRKAVAVEEALQQEVDAFGRPSVGRPAVVSVEGENQDSFQSSEGLEPVYIYYNSAVTFSSSLLLVGVTAAALLALRV